MSQLKSMNCPNCAAPITIIGNEFEIKCDFCGNMILVPPEMRRMPAPPAAQAHYTPPAVYPFAPSAPGPYVYNARRSFSRIGCLRLLLILFVSAVIIASGLNQMGYPLSGLLSALSSITGIGSPIVASFGGTGTGTGLFTDPTGLAIDGNDYIYVSDWKTGRIQRFDPNGNYVRSWDVPRAYGYGPECLLADHNGNIYACQDSGLLKYNGASGEVRPGNYGKGVALMYAGAVLVNGDVLTCACNSIQDAIFKFDTSGNQIAKYDNVIKPHEDNFTGNSKMAVDGLGNIYLLNVFNYHVLVYDANANFITRFGSEGHGTDQFDLPGSIAVDGQSNIYISDRGTIKVFDKNWHYLRIYSMPTGVYSIKAMTFNSRGALYALGYDNKVYKLDVNATKS